MFDLTAAEAILKQLYIGQVPENLVYSDNPTLAMLPKGEEFFGENLPIPLQYATANRSGSFSVAQGNIVGPSYVKFLLTRVKSYSVNQLDNETLLASGNDKGSFVRAVTAVADSVIQAGALGLSSAIFRNGLGTLATGTLSSSTVTLTNAADIVQFEVGMPLVASASDGGSLIGGATNIGTVATIDRSAGSFTVSGSPSSWTGTLYLGILGEMAAAGSAVNVSGFDAWIVGSSVTSTLFFNVDRTTDKVRLSGQVVDVSSLSVEEGMQKVASLVAREGGKPTHIITNFGSYNALVVGLGSKVQYIDDSVAEISFRGVALNGPNTVMKVFPDRSCPAKSAYVLQMNTWKLHSIGPAPRLLPYPDGNKYLRVATADASEIRAGLYGNLACSAPGWNAKALLSE